MRGEPVDPAYVALATAVTLAAGAALILAAVWLYGRERLVFGR
jgi:hypothetical protein